MIARDRDRMTSSPTYNNGCIPLQRFQAQLERVTKQRQLRWTLQEGMEEAFVIYASAAEAGACKHAWLCASVVLLQKDACMATRKWQEVVLP